MAIESDFKADFAAVAQAALSHADTLVPAWLAGGKREGHEWKCGDLSGAPGGSLSVNLSTGMWGDFAGDEKGGDLVSLYAAIHGMKQLDAARELARQLGLTIGAQRSDDKGAQKGARKSAPPTPVHHKPSKEWQTMVPVPSIAPQARLVHPFRGEPAAHWTYQRDSALYGYVCRFITSDGGKEVIPMTWCQSLADGTMKWQWKAWDEPRPLYLPGGTLRQPMLGSDGIWAPAPPIAIVEGEKCADALHLQIGEAFDVLSWPGGGKAVDKAAWDWIRGRRVIIWGDVDSLRRNLTKEEKAAGVDPESVDYLPIDKQPGNAAAVKLSQILLALECEVFLVPVVGPGLVPHGWDCADAIAGIGVDAPWGPAELRHHLRTARRCLAPVQTPAARSAEGISTATSVGTSAVPGISDEGVIAWWPHFSKSGPMPTRENVVHALRLDPNLRGCLGLNEFSHQVAKLHPVPWDTPAGKRWAEVPWDRPAGKWLEVDDLKLGEYLVHQHDMPSLSRAVLEEALRLIAHENRFHPIRERWRALVWDKEARLEDWLFYATGINRDTCPSQLYEYLRRVGKFYIMGMVMRIMQPGCKFDYMLVLEGPQGYRKSSLGRVLGGDYFSDTQLNLGDKDSYLQLQGRLVHEFSELHALANKDVTLVKAFISAQVDYLRAPFDRRPAEYPRQCVFFGTSNNPRWARDRTGNRRFWPVKIEQPVDTDWVSANLDQMIAEAVRLVDAGERCYPTYDEEIQFFQPEQASRVQTTVSEEALFEFLCGARDFKGGVAVEPPRHVTLIRCLEGMGLDVAKSASNRLVQNEVIELLHKWGWTHQRSGGKVNGRRPWGYAAPPVWPPAEPPEPAAAASEQFISHPHTQADLPESDDDVPF
jgi:putative DNA primase/helicase